MASQSQGIQQLLQAEKRAKDKLEEAKKRKNKRLRQAKEEAIAEIDQYKLKRENDFRRIQTTIMGSQGNLATNIDEQTGQKMLAYNANYQKYKENVLQELLKMIYDVNPELHVNYKYKE
ncbi:V-type proton ATPase subunit G 3 isoform X2 [Bufo gargarizans]|uniref:V-type proton ATPase subunit G 3 isoform X1 n=1 Tax=Bufo gargarizans TaxID=30331 RepID=UPI001CF3EF8E|nr:V-type proton ATPase subunit G 3 isoform X1 [Bufo gargarizans]XP_044157615.1 V-type proton ATPase subunit G 3 isoform X2 [Bufo gargarizans]